MDVPEETGPEFYLELDQIDRMYVDRMGGSSMRAPKFSCRCRFQWTGTYLYPEMRQIKIYVLDDIGSMR